MQRAVITAALTLTLASLGQGQVQPLEDAPSVLQLSSGAEIEVLQVFKTNLLETDEPALVLRYLTSEIKDEACREAQEVWAAFRPIIEKEKLRVAVVSCTTPAGAGFNWIWKQDAAGAWNVPKQDDIGRTVNGLNLPDLITIPRRAHAIVHLRLTFEAGPVKASKHPHAAERVIQDVSLLRTLKRSPGFLGDAAWREASSVWKTGDTRSFSDPAAAFVDYLVLNELAVGDVDQGTSIRGGLHLIPVTDGVLRNVERALDLRSE